MDRAWSGPGRLPRRGTGPELPSPDPNAGLGCQSELVARLHAEGVIPRVHISDDAIDPELLRSVRIRHQLLTDCVLRRFPAPGLGEAEKKTLVAGEPVDDWRRLAQERTMVGVKGNQDPTKVCDVLAQSQITVDVRSEKGLEGVVLPTELLGAYFEFLGVGGHPPIGEHPGGIELAPVVVERMRQLVANESAD